MRAIFISYRREDAEGQAGRLFDDLVRDFGDDSVFMDVAGLEPGRDFRRAIDEQVTSCGVLLAVIGKSWLDAKDESGQRRLDDPMDFVRLETASALKRDIPVIPVLVRGASMPRAEDLPEDLKELAFRNGVELTHARWDSDVQVLVKALRPYVQAKPEPTGLRPPSAPSEPGPTGRGSSLIIIAVLVSVLVLAFVGYLWHQKSSAEAARKAAALVEEKPLAVADDEKAKAEANRINKEKNAADQADTQKKPVPTSKTISTADEDKGNVNSLGIIYALRPNGDLLWNRHDGRNDGTFRWASSEGEKVGVGWNVKQAFSGGDGIIYALMHNGDLLWYRHDGRNDGTFRWASNEGKKVGVGWNVKQLFSGGDGIIYALMPNGDLLWYRHDGRNDGTFRLAFSEGKKVGVGWNFNQAFSGGDGIIYALMPNGDLLWYRHDGRNDGTFRWASNSGKKIGVGWNVKQLFSGGDGIIYALMPNGDLLWYRHDGRNDGTFSLAFSEGKKVGVGWNVDQAFSDVH